MLTAPTLDKLQALKLDAMAHAWSEQQQHAELTSLAFDERFGLLVDAEWLARDNKRVTRALKEAATCSRSSRTATAIARPSSRASCRRPSGTTTSPTPPWPMRSATASCTTPTGSC